jgi:hypothetical protein
MGPHHLRVYIRSRNSCYYRQSARGTAVDAETTRRFGSCPTYIQAVLEHWIACAQPTNLLPFPPGEDSVQAIACIYGTAQYFCWKPLLSHVPGVKNNR